METGESDDGIFRLLIVATEDAVGDILADVIKGHVGRRPAHVHLMAPAIADSRFAQLAGDVDDAMLHARERMTHSLSDLRRHGIEVSGGVGDSDPILAIDDELSQFPADEILVVTHPDQDSGWLEDDLFEKAREKFSCEITHVVLEHSGSDGELRPTFIEHADPG